MSTLKAPAQPSRPFRLARATVRPRVRAARGGGGGLPSLAPFRRGPPLSDAFRKVQPGVAWPLRTPATSTGIGQPFAYLESRMVIAQLMRHLDWDIVTPGALDPIKHLVTITLRPKPYEIKLKPRRPATSANS